MKIILILVLFVTVGHCYPVEADGDDILDDIVPDLVRRGIESRDQYRSAARFIFMVADLNEDGLLTVHELSRVTKPKDGSTPLQKAAELMRQMDFSGDNLLSEDEMVMFFRDLHQRGRGRNIA